MSRLKVMLRGALITEIELKKDREYIGGRKDGSDIRLQAEKGISREHFKLKFNDGEWNVIAVSRFGDVFSMGQKIEQIKLEHGQSFQIPPYEFQFLDVPESEITNSLMVSKVAQIDENEKTIIGVSSQVPYIKIVNSNGDVREMLRLEVGDVWVAGRDPSCQIVIPDQRVSRRQFELHKVNGNYTLIDLASVNGTFLNGSPVSSTDPQSLKSGDAITVLDNTLYFELHDPNFKYKLEKIEIPPIQIEQIEENTNALDEPSNSPEVPGQFPMVSFEQSRQSNPQLDPSGSPFTGMPPNSNENQFYTFTADKKNAENSTSGWNKIKQNKPLLFTFVALFLFGVYFLSEYLNEPQTVQPVVKSDEDKALAKLTPQQQSQVKEFYSLAQQMFDQEKYDLALEKLNKIHDLLKEGYKDSRDLETKANNALLTIAQQQQDEERQRIEAENTTKISQIAEDCRKLLKQSDITTDKMSVCLAPMAQINANAEQFTQLMSEAERLQRDREMKMAEAKTVQQQIDELIEIFKKAETYQNQGLAFKSMKQYKLVVSSNLPDPKNLKKLAKNRIEFIDKKVSDKASKSISQADVLVQENKLKQAVYLLRESLIYDPENRKINEKIESFREELRRQARQLYQESIIDESYGLVDSTDSKQGAKEKWKKITELDLDDGEYYKKAVIKLRRYGVL